MNGLQHFKNSKAYILQDILTPIIYVPDRQRDIHTMMRSYLSDETCAVDKDKILKNLVDCIEDRHYEQPREAVRDYYTHDDVEKLAAIMDRFIDGMLEGCAEGHLPPAKALIDQAWSEIFALDEKTGGHLLDTWRREEIQRWMTDACEASVHEVLVIKSRMGGMQML
ncbi:hypothetical protein C4588_00195 [Candidatus Parcubacteria bacterium]|nr:MAG: hypothetical protein C4588_00195 [Candidatus Parcubacteria bacterium]